MKDIRTAILMAADHIERNPHLFNFYEFVIPGSRPSHPCDSPGCALGWIAVFSAVEIERFEDGAGMGVRHHCPAMLGISDLNFYQRMDWLCGSWRYGADACAATLRLYADKYHPATPRRIDAVPDWRAIAGLSEAEGKVS